MLDYEDDLLARFDLVVASVHVARRQPRAELTRRTLNAIRSPHVDVIAHPSGRMIQTRDDLDLDWDAVFEAAAATGTALEINGSPHRLDLAAERARRAHEVGCVLSIDSDAHRTEELDYVRWGVDQARRAWVEPRHVLNTLPLDELLEWVAGKPGARVTPRTYDRAGDDFPGTSPRRSAVLARRELVLVAVILVAFTRLVEPADAFLDLRAAAGGHAAGGDRRARVGAQPAAVRAPPRPGGR